MGTPKNWYRYEVIEGARNLLIGDIVDVEATTERSARRLAHKDYPAKEYPYYRLTLVEWGTGDQVLGGRGLVENRPIRRRSY